MAYRIEAINHKTTDKVEAMESLNTDAYKGILRAANRTCDEEHKLIENLEKAASKHDIRNNIMVSPSLRRMADFYNKKHDANKRKGRQENERCAQLLYKCKATGSTMLGKKITKTNASPLLAVRRPERGPAGQPKGTIMTSPKEIDEIVRYGRIYEGNFGNPRQQAAAAAKYMKQYGKYIYEAPEANMQRITGKDLEDAAMHVENTAGGMDL